MQQTRYKSHTRVQYLEALSCYHSRPSETLSAWAYCCSALSFSGTRCTPRAFCERESAARRRLARVQPTCSVGSSVVAAQAIRSAAGRVAAGFGVLLGWLSGGRESTERGHACMQTLAPLPEYAQNAVPTHLGHVRCRPCSIQRYTVSASCRLMSCAASSP